MRLQTAFQLFRCRLWSDMSRSPLFENGRTRPVVALLVVAAVIAPCVGQAQSQSVAGARLHASTEINSQGVFVYRYTVENNARSTAGVWKVAIDISLPAGASE